MDVLAAELSLRYQLTMESRPSAGKIFALSIDESIDWAVADAGSDGDGVILAGTLDIPNGTGSGGKFKLQSRLISELGSLNIPPILLSEIAAVGVSTIGVVDHDERTLPREIPRKERWKESGSYDRIFLLDCVQVFSRLFGVERANWGALKKKISVQNDATGKALAEWVARGRPAQSLMYLNFDEGVNGGIITSEGAFFHGLHPEIGHILPLPHPTDMAFFRRDRNKVSGCRRHHVCYEGLASWARVRESWPHLDLGSIEASHEFWDILPFYMAQLAMASFLMFRPDLVVLGGTLIGDPERTLKRVNSYVASMNENYLPSSTINIETAKVDSVQIRIRGAIELARDLARRSAPQGIGS